MMRRRGFQRGRFRALSRRGGVESRADLGPGQANARVCADTESSAGAAALEGTEAKLEALRTVGQPAPGPCSPSRGPASCCSARLPASAEIISSMDGGLVVAQ